jgi:hypothetical protein
MFSVAFAISAMRGVAISATPIPDDGSMLTGDTISGTRRQQRLGKAMI